MSLLRSDILQANEALFEQSGPCPFAAYGTIIVNHTAADAVVCRGANFRTGDPTIHGEISAINACTKVFQERNMTASDIFAAWGELSIYTNAESCPMCASAIRWAGFKEYVYGTTIQHNYNAGWGVMTLSSYDVFQQSRQLPGWQTSMLGQILTNETDPLFSWQYNEVSRKWRYEQECMERLTYVVELSLPEQLCKRNESDAGVFDVCGSECEA